MSDLEHLYASRFNYWDDIQPALTDFTAESDMALRLVREDGLSIQDAFRIVHDIVHVSKHYTIVDGHIDPIAHEQMK